MTRWLAIGGLAFLLGGCFVLDEIDSGQELMKQHSPKSQAEAEAESDEGESKDAPPGFLERAKRFWGELGGDGQGKAQADSSPPPHPDNTLVRCDVDGRLEFTRKFTCHRKGGKVLGPMHTSQR